MYTLVGLRDKIGGLEWDAYGSYDTVRDAVKAGEWHVDKWDWLMYRVYKKETLVWESVTPRELRAHP